MLINIYIFLTSDKIGSNFFQMKTTKVKDLEVALNNTTPDTPTDAATQARGNTPNISITCNSLKKEKRTTPCNRDHRPGEWSAKI